MKPVTYDKWFLSIRTKEPLEDRYFDGCEIRICDCFGCGKPLSMIESLSGNKCTEHLKVKKIDPMDVIKLK